ncbi:MAG: PKD domain-containing protein [Anaeromyxobacter sp.]|nr:PKD domain-containing protein [Anaeromyxobacter sp.]
MTNGRITTLSLAALLAGVLTACGTASTTDAVDGQTPGAELEVTPSFARVGPTQTVGFTAAASALSTQITWTVQEGAAGGAVTADGLYTAPALNGTFHVVAASSADPTKNATATVVVVGQPPPVTGAPMTTAHRTSGIAPLSVFFDAIDTVASGNAAPYNWSSGVYQPPDADYEAVSYVWDFGDGGAGVWTTTGASRNVATGYTTAHVYESPGTYTASLTVTDKGGTVYTYKQTITVSAFGGTTYYVSGAGSDGNDGLSSATAFLTAAKGLSMAGPNRQILFRRGDTFQMTKITVTAAGPGIIGAYGSGNRPVLVSGATGDAALTLRGADWRVMDLEITGSGTGAWSAVGFDVSYQTVNPLLLRLSAPNWAVGLGWSDWTPIYATPHDGATIMECEVAGSSTNGMYVGGRRLAVLGNNVHDMGDSHVLRVWQAHKGVIAHNRLWNPGPTRHAIKLHGPPFNGVRPETRWVTISDNLIRGKTWSVAIGPQDGGVDERLSHVVFERNRFLGEASVQVDLEIWARQVMVRNNVFDGTGASNYYTAVAVGQRGVELASRDVRVINNTMVRNDSFSQFEGLRVQPVAENVIFRNNLASAPLASSRLLVAGSGGAGFASDHNLLSSTPGFTSAAGGDYSLVLGSPAVDAGLTVAEVRTDYSGFSRPLGAGPDLGAIESR